MSVNSPLPVLPDYYSDEVGRKRFVKHLFNATACDYDRVERMTAFGSGSWYRRKALQRAGLRRGMHVLDVAAGTGLIAREAVDLTGDPGKVIALDPSGEMLRRARSTLAISTLQATGERIPCRSDAFDFLSMGYALRHLSDLHVAFGEFFRVVRPGGTICLLEITRPRGRFAHALLKLYIKHLVPWRARLMTRRTETPLLMRFYWDTIEACVPPSAVLEALVHVGFEQIDRHIELGIFSEYTARKPA
jgi:demethylmenaquinone methyltransferase/2-methoxy-6-polyprenyl-1,4-benzoquinol methylase